MADAESGASTDAGANGSMAKLPGFNLYIGDIRAGRSEHIVAKKFVVDVSNALPETEEELTAMKAAGGKACRCLAPTGRRLVVMGVPDTDGAALALAPHFEFINAFIDKALALDKDVVVHCFEGKSRSAAVLIQFLMKRKKLSLRDAVSGMRRVRPGMRLNNGFRKYLNDLELKMRPDAPTMTLRMQRKPTLRDRAVAASK